MPYCNGSCAVVAVSDPGVVTQADADVDGAWFGCACTARCEPLVAAAALPAVTIAATTPVAAHNERIRERFDIQGSSGSGAANGTAGARTVTPSECAGTSTKANFIA
jgi:hypothetical protein